MLFILTIYSNAPYKYILKKKKLLAKRGIKVKI
jgi:hypothetical protein